MAKLSKSFHRNHFLMLSLKQKLLAAYRKEVATPNPQKKIMQKMCDVCKEMYDMLEIIEPGISRLKGIFNRVIYLFDLVKSAKNDINRILILQQL